MSVNPTSPAELFGGTWEPLDQGRVLIGAGTSHPAGETGGEETHKLTTNEMPSHNHTMNSAGSHYHSGSTYDAGSHSHSKGDMNIVGTLHWWKVFSRKNDQGYTRSGALDYIDGAGRYTSGQEGDSITVGFKLNAKDGWTGNTSSSGTHSHSLDISSAGSHQHTIDNTGGNGSHNNMQPYLSVYMWKRTV